MRFLIVFCLLYAVNVRSEHYIINVVESWEGHTQQDALQIAADALYAPLGIKPNLVFYPSKRGLQLVDEGVIDAEAARLELVLKEYTNIIKVDEPLTYTHSGVYCITAENCKLSKDSKVVALNSFQAARALCKLRKLKCSHETNPKIVARLLKEGIVHAYLSASLESQKVLCELDLKTLYFHYIKEFSRASYHFVNKRHAALVPELEESVRDLKRRNLLPDSEFKGIPAQAACGKTIITV